MIFNKNRSVLTGGQKTQKDARIRQYYAFYTALFALMCIVVYCWYFFTKRTFIWQSDGWYQHYKALVYYARYMRSAVRELLFNHRFAFPEWDFALGEGNDILQSLHYYVIGDPFSILSVFVPTRFLWIYYDFMILLRLYLSGIAFSSLCFYTRKNIGRYAVMAGALSYVFCYWSIFNTARHPYFLNPMLYFPLIVLGIEKLLRKERSYLLIFAVFLAAISNFYFFYNIVLITVAYVLVRLIFEYKRQVKSIISALLKIAGQSLLGVTMGGIILLPVIFDFLNDTRMEAGNAWHFLYPLSYYSGLPGAFFTNGDYWQYIGCAAPVILALFLMFFRKGKYKLFKTYFILCLTIILIPTIGQVLNGMSYMSNKWCWAYVLLCSYVFTMMWQELMNLKYKDAVKLTVALSVYFALLLIFEYSRSVSSFACICTAFIFLIVLLPLETESTKAKIMRQRRKQAIALLLVLVSVANISLLLNSYGVGNYANESVSIKTVREKLMDTEVKTIKKVAKSDGMTDFYRYSGKDLTYNSGTLYHLSNTNYYWSISNSAIADFRRVMELREPVAQDYKGYDDRTSLLALSSVKYFAVEKTDKTPIPYGYTYAGSPGKSDYNIYRNENTLPLAYFYDNILSEAAYNKLSAVEKQEAMLQAVTLAGYSGKTQDDAVDYSSRSLDYTVKRNSSGVTLEDYGFVVTKKDATITLNFDGLSNSETYFVIKGLDFEGVPEYELYFGDKKYDPKDLYTEEDWDLLTNDEQERIKRENIFFKEPNQPNIYLKASTGLRKRLGYKTEDYSYYNDRHDFTVNLYYEKEALNSITLFFSEIGVYSFDSLEVVCQPMDDFADKVSALKETVLENTVVDTDRISGTVSLDKPQVLCLSVSYSVGWTAYVDGKEAELYRANIKNMALLLNEGEHDIKLIYHTPYLRHGALVSAVGFAVFFAILLTDIFKKRKAVKAQKE